MVFKQRNWEAVMWDVLIAIMLMGFGALAVIVVGAIFIAALFYIQDEGGK